MPVASPARRTRRSPRQEQPPDQKLNGIGSAAVERATGKTWNQWLRILDHERAASMAHGEIAELLSTRHGVADWWSQMVTVGYEQARGLRQKHQRPDGYSVSVSKTVGVSVGDLYRAWAKAGVRARWLGDFPLEVRRATRGKSMRITWAPRDAATHLDVNFLMKGTRKAQVAVEHAKLKTAAEAAE